MILGSERSTGEGIGYPHQYSWAPLVAQLVKNFPTMQETWIRSLDWKDPLEKVTAAHSSILAEEFHGLYCPWGHKKLNTMEQLSLSNASVFFLSKNKKNCPKQGELGKHILPWWLRQ